MRELEEQIEVISQKEEGTFKEIEKGKKSRDMEKRRRGSIEIKEIPKRK